MNKSVMFSSASEHWSTPKDLYASLDAEFHFDYDPCPLHSEVDGLKNSWEGKRVFCNPPYGHKERAFLEHGLEADVAVFLIPARTDTIRFHEIIMPHAKEIRFVKGRLHFSGAKNGAPFPSMIVVFRKEKP
jgi:site-specific DNA-methyltransferase (adenine-specific)